MVVVTGNSYSGLWEGPIDHEASSVINAVVNPLDDNDFVFVGEAVRLTASTTKELLPAVTFTNSGLDCYGIVVGGDNSGIYPSTGEVFVFDEASAIPHIAGYSGQGVSVVTQGRCIARMTTVPPIGSAINIGDPLTSTDNGELTANVSNGDDIVARALQSAPADGNTGDIRFIAIDFQREGIL